MLQWKGFKHLELWDLVDLHADAVEHSWCCDKKMVWQLECVHYTLVFYQLQQLLREGASCILIFDQDSWLFCADHQRVACVVVAAKFEYFGDFGKAELPHCVGNRVTSAFGRVNDF